MPPTRRAGNGPPYVSSYLGPLCVDERGAALPPVAEASRKTVMRMAEPATRCRLRPTTAADLDFVDGLETHPANAPFIGRWSRDEHLAAIAAGDREHWLIESVGARSLGYLIAYDLVRRGMGAYVKRIVVDDKSRGIGRAALSLFCEHAFAELGAPFVWLTVYPENGRGLRCYRGLGFAEMAVAPARRDELRAAVAFSAHSLLLSLPRPAPAS